MIEVVTSSQNKMIKLIASLKQKKYRDEYKLVIAEGIRLVEEAIHSDWDIYACIFTEKAALNNRVKQIIERLISKKQKLIQVSEQLYHQLGETEQPQGIMVVLKQKDYSWQEVKQEGCLIAVLDQIQDPGNVGTMIRTADAVGCTAVVMTKGCADIYAPKTVRATMGSLFHLPLFYGCEPLELIDVLQQRQVPIYATTLDECSIYYFKADFTAACAVVFGNEGNGVSKNFMEASQEKIHIPMSGKAESLNVAVSAAVVLYEAVRQRVFYLENQ